MAQIDMIGIVVKNMEKALDFYRALGVHIPQGAEKEDHVDVVTANGYRIAWDTEELTRSLNPGWTRPQSGATGCIALAFLCDSPADVDTTFRRLVGLGYRPIKEPYDAFWGQRYANVLDPDGNVIDLFAALGG